MNVDSDRQHRHGVLPQVSHDEFSRQEFVKSLKFHLASEVSPKNRQVYAKKVEPLLRNKSGKDAIDRHDVRRAMSDQPYYQFWSSLLRTSQEMMWSACQLPIERQLPDLISAAGKTGKAGGSLRLDSKLETPRYHRAVDIHCQPGGYHTEFAENDLSAGALYDSAVYVYAMGRMGPFNDDMGASQAAYIRRTFPQFKPKRILDLGCAVGHSTVPYVDAFPDAEVFAIDVAAPMLRYAHARAESLGKRVQFSQQNAEAADFADGYFDLVVSHILLHETSAKALERIVAECHRLLAPGGLMVHSETPPYSTMDAFDAFMLDWDTYNNNEPFWGYVHELDLRALTSRAGFDPERVFEALAPSAFEEGQAKRTNIFQGGDFGGGGAWYLWGCWK
jgi:SAM-dependent methyltransferase